MKKKKIILRKINYMSNYFIGDIHGCFKELKKILLKVSFDSKKDNLWVTGDLVARGPDSLNVLYYLQSLGSKLKLVLGNHDLHLISAFYGINTNKNKNYINYLSNSTNPSKIIDWLRRQPLMQIDEEKKIIMSHAGINPQWDIKTAKTCALEIQYQLSKKNCKDFFNLLNKNNFKVNSWNDKLTLSERLQFSINSFTKMRYCYKNGNLNINIKKISKDNSELKPWFNIPSKISKKYSIFFGHWSCVSAFHTIPKNIFALDTGCCWGHKLTLFRWEDKKIFTQKYLF